MSNGQADFFRTMLPYARRVSELTGIDPRLVLAQSALETGYGRSAPNYNFFGIKAPQGQGASLMTSEFENGQMVRRSEPFRSYASPEESFMDYASLLLRAPRYRPVLNASTLDEQILAMANSGYATDPEYGSKLSRIASSINLNDPTLIASDAMSAIGRGPDVSSMTATDRGRPAMNAQPTQIGLLAQGAEQPRSGLQAIFTPDVRDRLSIALEGMSLRPNQGIVQMAQQRIADRQEQQRSNATVAWLRSRGRDDLAAALEAGASPQTVMAEAIRAVDVNVQSSAPLPDQSGVVLTMRDGSVQVRTVGGETLTGQAALDYVRNAQERAAEYQRSIYGARREGTLGADIGMGEQAAAAGARGTELGRAQGAAIAGAPIDVATADTTLGYIAEVRRHPGKSIGTGASSLANIVPGTPGYDFQNRVNQLLSGGFLTAIDQLRGMGALSNAEGQTATRAISRMNTATSEAEFDAALADYEAVVRAGRDRAAARIQQPAPSAPETPAAPATRLRYNPETRGFE